MLLSNLLIVLYFSNASVKFIHLTIERNHVTRVQRKVSQQPRRKAAMKSKEGKITA